MNRMTDPERLRHLQHLGAQGNLLALFDLMQLQEDHAEKQATLDCLAQQLPDADISLKKLHLTDFKIFKNLKIDLDSPDRTIVIIGNNGAGKTSILEAIAKAISWLVANILKANNNGRKLTNSDIRVDSTQAVEVNVEFLFNQHTVVAMKQVKPIPGVAAGEKSQLQSIKMLADMFRIVNALKEIPLPLFAVYFVKRSYYLDSKETTRKERSEMKYRHRFDAYNEFDGGTTDFSQLVDWLIELDNQARFGQARFGSAHMGAVSSQNLFMRVKKILLEILAEDGFEDPHPLSDILLDRSTGRVDILVQLGAQNPINIFFLSEGQKIVLALLGDIMRRMVLLNPQSIIDDPFQTKGMIAIDELELHLHPSWQQKILVVLQKNFPNIQWVVTTHSPQVLTSQRKESIIILHPEGNTVLAHKAQFSPLAKSSDDASAHLMQVYATPKLPVTDLVISYEQLVKNGQEDTPEARDIFQQLQKLGYEFEVDQLRAWQLIGQYKNRRS